MSDHDIAAEWLKIAYDDYDSASFLFENKYPNALCGAQGVRSQESEFRMIESATRTDLIFVFFIAGNNP